MTTRQRQILTYIRRAKGPLTFRRIAAHFGINANAARGHVGRLREQGRVTWDAKLSGTIRAVERRVSYVLPFKGVVLADGRVQWREGTKGN